MIDLKGQAPVASGSLQLVYQHPTEPDYLIKILQLDKMRKRWNRKSRGLPIPRRFGLYSAWIREVSEYMALRSRMPDGVAPEFMQRHYGFVDTDIGPGMLVGKVTDREGALAPDLALVVQRHGITDDLCRKLVQLRSRIEELNLPTTDISVRNILLGWSEAQGDHLVVIEGFGMNTLIPVKRWIPALNRRSIRRHFMRTFKQVVVLNERRSQNEDKARRSKMKPSARRADLLNRRRRSFRLKTAAYAVGAISLFATFIWDNVQLSATLQRGSQEAAATSTQ